MRHRKAGVKLNKNSSHRQAMFRNMVTSLFKYDRIKTTDVRAKEVSRWADHIITLAKRGDLHARRQAMAIVREKNVVHKLFEEAKERFGNREGGYTRVVKLGNRPGDAALISVIEFVTDIQAAKKKKKKTKVASPQTAPVEKKADVEEQVQADAEASADVAQAAEPTETAPQEEIEAAPDADAAAVQEAGPEDHDESTEIEDPEKKSE